MHIFDKGSKMRDLDNFLVSTLQKHAYSNIQKFSPPKTENFQIKMLIFDIYLLKT